MPDFSISPKELATSLVRIRDLVATPTRSKMIGRYRASFMGILWSFFNPVFMLFVYTLVFSVVFKACWSGGSGSKIEFALVLFSGMVVFNLCSKRVNLAPSLTWVNHMRRDPCLGLLGPVPTISAPNTPYRADAGALGGLHMRPFGPIFPVVHRALLLRHAAPGKVVCRHHSIS